MRIALAAVGLKTNDTERNKDRIISVLREYGGRADMAVFGETFLQGFDCLACEYARDRETAVTQDSPVIGEIRAAAARNRIAAALGYVERDGEKLYSSLLVIGKDGGTIADYRRISPGWKEKRADGHYREGDRFLTFPFEGRRFSAALCGDLWYDENIRKMRELAPDIVLWPVYVDYTEDEWNASVKYEYARQAARACENVLFVNPVCLDPARPAGTDPGEDVFGPARGGAAYFRGGEIALERAAGKEGVLVVGI